ncbi:hypothetical protein [Lyngbya aestuarii]|nr:hypothetical protein [Lyngbya aestuarii]
MSIFKKTSESLSGVTSALKPLTQPRFWGSMGVTAVVVAFIWQVSEHPEWFELDDIKQAISDSGNLEDRLSQEERSIAADIDSSAVLLKELEGPQLLPFPMDTPINAGVGVQDQVRKSRLDRSTTPQTSSNPRLEQQSPSDNSLPTFSVTPTPSEPNNILNFNSTPTLSTTTPSPQNPSGLTPQMTFDANFPSATATEEGTSTQSPLQAAMDQQSISGQGQSQSSSSSSPSTDYNDPVLNFNQPQVNSINTPGRPIPSTPTTVGTQPTVQIPPATWIVPRTTTTPTTPTSPIPTTNSYQTNISITSPVIPAQPIIQPSRTGAAVTPDLQSIYNSYGAYPNVNSNGSYGAPFPNNNASSPSAYPGYSNNASTNPQDYQVNQNTLIQNNQADQFNQMNQRPFSAPRPVPGRRIGGGEINTFANP